MTGPLNFEDACAALAVTPDIAGAVKALSRAELEVALLMCEQYATVSGHDRFAVFWSELAVLLGRERVRRRVAVARDRAIADALLHDALGRDV